MALCVRKFGSVEEMSLFLQGAAIGGVHGGNIHGLVGKSLLLTRPAAIVTFVTGADATGAALTFSEVRSQIQSAAPAISVQRVGYDGKILLIESAPMQGIAIGDCTARNLLGFGAGVDTKVYAAPGGSGPAFVSAYYDSNSNGHVLVTSE